MASYSLTDSAMAELNAAAGDFKEDFDMEEDSFVDAPEHQDQYGRPMDINMIRQAQSFDLPAIQPANGTYNSTPHLSNFRPMLGGTYNNSSLDIQPAQSGPHIYSPFNRQPTQNRYNPALEPEEIINVNKTSATEKHAAAYRDLISGKKDQQTSQTPSNHAPGCTGIRSASTPPATPPSSQPKDKEPTTLTLNQKVWLGPDDLRDISKAFLREKRWHEKVSLLHPNSALAAHRYWIGVLNPKCNARNACKEEHFTWLKGNRLTTVETVRKVWMATTMLEGVVLLVGGERPEDEERMEELDFFNDKIVLFKLVQEGEQGCQGRMVTEGLVTKEIEVIDLLEDD